VIQKNKKTMIKEKGKEICQRVLDTNFINHMIAYVNEQCYNLFKGGDLYGKYISTI